MKTAKEKEIQGTSLQIEEPKNKGFAIIYNPLKNDRSLTLEEKAILWTLITATSTFKPTMKGLESLLKISHHTLLKTTKSLQNKGYLIIENKATKSAKWRVIFDPLEEERETPTFEQLIQGAKKGKIDLENLADLVKNHLITRQEASKIIEEAQAFAKRLAKSFYDED